MQKQEWVFPLFSLDSDDRLSLNCVILYISCDTRSVVLGQYCLPKVHNGFNTESLASQSYANNYTCRWTAHSISDRRMEKFTHCAQLSAGDRWWSMTSCAIHLLNYELFEYCGLAASTIITPYKWTNLHKFQTGTPESRKAKFLTKYMKSFTSKTVSSDWTR